RRGNDRGSKRQRSRREEPSMTASFGCGTLRATCMAAAALLLLAAPAMAQKQGGSITVGLELDIPGLDPLKVGVYDTAAEMAAALIFDTPHTPSQQGAR